MADPVATVEKIVKIGLKIKEAVDTVRHNEDECREIRKRVLRFSAILLQLQQTGMMNDSPAMSGALEDLEETLQHALDLVTACQERSAIRRLITAGELSKQLRRVKDDILNKVMLASFAIHTTTIVLLTIQAGGHPPSLQQEDTRIMEVSHTARSTDDTSLKNFSLSELKDAINSGYIIGRGGFCEVYKGVLNDKSVVVIKKPRPGYNHRNQPATLYDQLLLVSKLQHKNIVKVLGYGCEVVKSSFAMRLLKCKDSQVKERELLWAEEYAPNGSLDMITNESQLDWPSFFKIIEGVAQGIHYLHEQHIIHRDVKPSNILLDSDMNPKISDFELCMVLNDDEITHNIIAGTYGYMAPEYALQGIVSMKIDVFAFGVTLLRIIGVMSGFESDSKQPLYGWDPQNDQVVMEEVFDPSLFDGCQLMEIKRCVEVGLLCIQNDRADRPTMADVLEMLHGNKELPTPKKQECTNSDIERPSSPSSWSEGSLSPR